MTTWLQWVTIWTATATFRAGDFCCPDHVAVCRAGRAARGGAGTLLLGPAVLPRVAPVGSMLAADFGIDGRL